MSLDTPEENKLYDEFATSDVDIIDGPETFEILMKTFNRLIDYGEHLHSDFMLEFYSVIQCQPKLHASLNQIEDAMDEIANRRHSTK